MNAVLVAAWAASGIAFYEFARRSWNRRWKDGSAPGSAIFPLNYVLAAICGLGMLGAALCEMLISSRNAQ